MKVIFFYFKLVYLLVKNFGSNIDILIDDSASNSSSNIRFIENSLYIMVVLNYNIVIFHGQQVIRIYDEEDVADFISSYLPGSGGNSGILSNLEKISKKSILLCYSDFFLSDVEYNKISKYKKRILVSKSGRSGSILDPEIIFI